MNKEFIVKNLCEEKDVEESCCKGSCHLTKELVKVEEKENDSPLSNETNKKTKTEENQQITSVVKSHFFRPYYILKLMNAKNQPLSSGYLAKLIKPPSI